MPLQRFTVRGPARTSMSGTPLSVDVSELKAFAKDLRAADKQLAKAMQLRLRKAGELVADEARRRSSFSRRIPASIKVRVSGVTVKVVAGGSQAELAAAVENHGRGYVRHPVFVPKSQLPGPPGRWTNKNSHPAFLAPALEAKQEQVVEMVAAAVDETLREAKFRAV